jgi:DNA-directed RNA polymerase subunit RPC12/RpoP
MDVPTDSIGEQLECPDCGRRFNPAPYERHVKICAKVFLQKRKVFDSTKMRTKDDPELAKLAQQALKKEKQQQKMAQMKAAAPSNRNDGNVVQKGDSTGRSDLYHELPSQNDSNIAKSKPSKPKQSSVNTEGVGNKSSKWKDQSKAFREAMRAARQVTQAIAEGKPLPPPVMSAPDPSLIPCPHCGRRFNEKAAERHIPQCQNIKAKPSSLKRGSGGVATTANAAGRKVTGRGGF